MTNYETQVMHLDNGNSFELERNCTSKGGKRK